MADMIEVLVDPAALTPGAGGRSRNGSSLAGTAWRHHWQKCVVAGSEPITPLCEYVTNLVGLAVDLARPRLGCGRVSRWMLLSWWNSAKEPSRSACATRYGRPPSA